MFTDGVVLPSVFVSLSLPPGRGVAGATKRPPGSGGLRDEGRARRAQVMTRTPAMASSLRVRVTRCT